MVAFHADVLGHAGTRDEPLRTTAWEANQFLAVGPLFRVTVTPTEG